MDNVDNKAQTRKPHKNGLNLAIRCSYLAEGAITSKTMKGTISQSQTSSTPKSVWCEKPKLGTKSRGKQKSQSRFMRAPHLYSGCTPEAVWLPARLVRTRRCLAGIHESVVVRCIGNKEQKKPEVCNWSLKPSQMAPDQDGAVMCQRSHVFWEVGNPASATPSRQMLKAGVSIEINVKAAFLDPHTEFSLLVQCRPECKRFVKSSYCLQYRAPRREIATGNMLYQAITSCAKTTLRGCCPGIKPPWRRAVSGRKSLVDPARDHAYIWLGQSAKMFGHQRRAAAYIVIDENNGFVLGLLPPIVAGEWQSVKRHFMIRNQVVMCKNQVQKLRVFPAD